MHHGSSPVTHSMADYRTNIMNSFCIEKVNRNPTWLSKNQKVQPLVLFQNWIHFKGKMGDKCQRTDCKIPNIFRLNKFPLYSLSKA